MNDIAQLIKRAAVEAVESEKPAAVMFGTVSGINPLEITVEQKLRLSGAQLVTMLSDRVYVGEGSFLRHKVFEIGDCAALLREQGGQRFIVLGVI